MRWWITNCCSDSKTNKEISTGRAPDFDSIPIEILFQGSVKLIVENHQLISDMWLGASVVQDWVNAIQQEITEM